tara:strand:- start:225 stop:911 length:687 start_codon:yes stop_codon:yes gene_type:complete
VQKFVRAVGQIFLYLIYFVIVMVSARLIAQWSVPLLVSQFPFLIYITPLFVVATFALFLSKRLREKIKKGFLNLSKKTTIKGFLLPKNKLGRLVVNVLFIPVWYLIYVEIFLMTDKYGDSLIDQNSFMAIVYFFIPIIFYTLFLWNEKLRRNIANTFINAGLSNKEIKRRFESTANYLSESSKVASKSRRVQSNISDADELKKYAELRDQGIITEEEFQAKKKKLLDD